MDGAGRDSRGAAPLTHTSTSPAAATQHPGSSTDAAHHSDSTEKATSGDDVSAPESGNRQRQEEDPAAHTGGVGGESGGVAHPQGDATDGGVLTVPPFGYYLRRKTAFVNVERIKRFLASSLESEEEEEEGETVRVDVSASSEGGRGAGAREEPGARRVSFGGALERQDSPQSGLSAQDPSDGNSGTFAENRPLAGGVESYENSGSIGGNDSLSTDSVTQRKSPVGGPIRVVVTERSFRETSCVEKDTVLCEKITSAGSCDRPKGHQSGNWDPSQPSDYIGETASSASATAKRGEKSEDSSAGSVGSEKESAVPSAEPEDTDKGQQQSTTGIQQREIHRGSISSLESSHGSTAPATGALVSALKNGKKKLVKRVSFADEGSERKSLVEEFELREEEPVQQQEKREKPVPPPRCTALAAPRVEKPSPETTSNQPQRLVLQKTEGGVARLVRVTWLDSSAQGKGKKRDEELKLQGSKPEERLASEEARGASRLRDGQPTGPVDGAVAAKAPASPARIFVFPDQNTSSHPQDPGPSGSIWRQDSTPTSDDVFLSPTEEAAFASSGRPFSSFVSSALADRPAEVEAVDVLSVGDSVVSVSDSSRASGSRGSLSSGSAPGYPSSSDSAFIDLAPSEDLEDEEGGEDSGADDRQRQRGSSSGSSDDESDENSGYPEEPVTQVNPSHWVRSVTEDPEPKETDGRVLPEGEFWGEASVVKDRSVQSRQDSVLGSELRFRPVENGALTRTGVDLAGGATGLSVKEVLLPVVVKNEVGAAAPYFTEVEQVGDSPLNGKTCEYLSSQEKCVTLNYVSLDAEKGRGASVGDWNLGGGKASLERHDSSQLPPTPPPSPVEGEEWEGAGKGDPPRAGPSRAYPPQEEEEEVVLDTQCLRDASTTGSRGSKEQSAGILPIPEEGAEDGGREKRDEEPDSERDENCARQRPEEGQLTKQEESTPSSSAPPETDPTNAAVATVLVLTKDEVCPEEDEREEAGVDDKDRQKRVQRSEEVTAAGDAETLEEPQQQVEESGSDTSGEESNPEMPGPPEGEGEVPLKRALDHIEQLQQNLSTRLSPGAVQAIRAEFKGASPAASPSGPGSTPDNARRREEFFRDGLSGTSPAGGSGGGGPATWRRSAELSPPRAAHKSPPGGSTAAAPGVGADSWRRSVELPGTTVGTTSITAPTSTPQTAHNVTVVTKRVLWVAETEPPPAGKPKAPATSDGGGANASSPPKSNRVFISLSPRSVEKLVSGQRAPGPDNKTAPATRTQQNGSTAADASRPGSGRDRPDGAAGSPAGRRPGPRPAIPAVKPSVTPRKDTVIADRTAAVSREDSVPREKVSSPAGRAAASGGSSPKASGKPQGPEARPDVPTTPKTESNTRKPEVPPKSISQRSSLADSIQQSPESPPGAADISASTTVESTGDDTDIPYADSDDEASAGEMSPMYRPSAGTGKQPAGDTERTAAAAARQALPAGRMSWTQQLLDKLSEEEDAKRKRQAEAPRKPPRLVRYPGQREAEEAQRRASAPTGYHPLQTVGATDPVLAGAVPGTDAYADLIDRLIEEGSPAARHRPYRQQYGPGGVPLRRQASLEEDSGSTTSSDGAETARLRQKFEEELRTVAAMQQRRQAADSDPGARGGEGGAVTASLPPVTVQETAPVQRAVSPAQRVRSPPPSDRSTTAPRGYQTVKVTALVEKPSTPPKRQPAVQAKPSASTPSPPKQLTSSPDRDAIKPKPISPVVRRTVTSPQPPAGARPQQAVPKLRSSPMQHHRQQQQQQQLQQQLQQQQQQQKQQQQQQQQQKQQQQQQQQQQLQQEQQQQQQKTKSSGLRRFLSPAASLFASATGNSPRNRRSLSEDRSSRSSPLLLKPYKSKKQQQQQQQPNAQEEAAQRQPLLAQKKSAPQAAAATHDAKRKVYPSSNAPLVETAFLSEPKKPAPTAAQQNLLNAGADYRNKPLPPVPPHRTSSRSSGSAGTAGSGGTVPAPVPVPVPVPTAPAVATPAGGSSHSTARTIPDTSLVLEERLDSIRRSLTPTQYNRSEAPAPADFAGRRHQKRYQSLPPMSSLPATRQQLEAIERAARGSPPASEYRPAGKPSAVVSRPVYQQVPANASAGVYQNVQQTNRARQQASYPEAYYHSRQHDTQSDTEALRQSRLPTQRGRGESVASDGADTVQSSRSVDASSPSSSSTATVVSSSQQQQRWRQKPGDAVDAADVSPGGAEVQRVLQARPPVVLPPPSGRMSAPPSTTDWQRRYGRIQQPLPLPLSLPLPQSPPALVPVSAAIKVTREPVYSNLSQATPAQQPQRRQHVPLSPVSPPPDGTVRLSRRELEALYWQTQLLREELAAQKRYLGMTGPAPASDTSVASTATAGSGGGTYASVLPRPQPVYASPQPQPQPQQHRRSRSMSPSPYHGPVSPGSAYPLYASNRSLSLSLPRGAVLPELYDVQPLPQQPFVRGAPYRNTVAGIRSHSVSERTSTPTIYEEAAHQQAAAPRRDQGADGTPRRRSQGAVPGEGPPPIFKRGSLQGLPEPEGPASSAPKRVSFTPGEDASPRPNWPTRNGPAARPPTRNRDSVDSDVFLPNSPPPAAPAANYVNLSDLGYAYGYGYGYGTSMAAERRRPYGVVVRRSAPPGSVGSPTGTTPDRPLPPLPPSSSGELSGSNSSVYGVVVRKPQLQLQQPAQLSPDRWQYRAAFPSPTGRWPQSESESGSEAGEIQRILGRGRSRPEEEWSGDGKPRSSGDQSGGGGGGSRDDSELRGRGGGGGGGGGGGSGGRASGGGRSRDDPRRHTLSGTADHHQHQQHHQHQHQHQAMAGRAIDLESPLPRGYPPLPSAMLFDDDPGIMSEVETSSTGFRRGGKQRSSLPVVRTPSKTLERPLGLVFLQYRSETKRALLPNEITSLDTVKALFVRSFPKQLTMEYLDSPMVKIYIHDSSKDMFYELEDLRSHLREIRDRSVLRLFEAADVNGGVLPGAGVGLAPPPPPSAWDQDQSYFSEPEFDSDYHHQHIHKSKASSKSSGAGAYYMTHSYPPGPTTAPGGAATLPRGAALLRTYSPAVVGPKAADRLHTESGYMSSPERGGPSRAYAPPYAPAGASAYEDPYYSQYAPRSGSITPVIDEEARIRVEHMERQLANLTGLVQKALTQTPTAVGGTAAGGPTPAPRDYAAGTGVQSGAGPGSNAVSTGTSAASTASQAGGRDTGSSGYRNDKSVSFEKSVSFSDEPPDMNSPKQHSPQHSADSKPTKPAIKSSTLPRMSSQERDRHKPAPPPKPVSLSPGQYDGRHVYRADLQLTPEMYNQLRGLQKKAKDLRQEVRNLRRMSQAQAHSVRETIRDTFIKIRAMLLSGGEEVWAAGGDAEKLRLSREEDLYKQEMLRLEKDLTELESTVEELRGNVINRKTRVNMSDVENMALILSKSSKTVADLKVRFPSLQEGMKSLLSSEMEKVVREEKFLKEEPERLESALRRCKKLTGTLVTLKRLASVQEQRLPPSTTPDSRLSPTPGGGGADSDTPITPPAHGKASKVSRHLPRAARTK